MCYVTGIFTVYNSQWYISQRSALAVDW